MLTSSCAVLYVRWVGGCVVLLRVCESVGKDGAVALTVEEL
jgi:hypothetical protein